MTRPLDPADPALLPEAAPASSQRLAAATVRKMLRDQLSAYKQRSTLLAFALLGFDIALFAAGTAMVLALPWWGMAAGGFLVWLAIARVPSFAYFRTPAYWHCDHFGGYPVQHYVAAQLTIAFDAAVALVAYLTTDRRAA